MAPKPATIKAMSEVLGPIIGITLVLMSVFLPTVFLGGITGRLYQQFALTIAATAFISAINAMTLKPAQCALWLRPPKERKNIFSRGFNAVYGWFERVYTAIDPVPRPARGDGDAGVRFARRADGVVVLPRADAAFFPRKIKATFWSACNFPTPPRNSEAAR